jgi:hypothetical protein
MGNDLGDAVSWRGIDKGSSRKLKFGMPRIGQWIASSRAHLAVGCRDKSGARPLDRAGQDRPRRSTLHLETLAKHRGARVAAAIFSTSIHRFVIVGNSTPASVGLRTPRKRNPPDVNRRAALSQGRVQPIDSRVRDCAS